MFDPEYESMKGSERTFKFKHIMHSYAFILFVITLFRYLLLLMTHLN